MPAPATEAARLLRALRAHAELSQREIAQRAGVSPSTIARAESSRGAPPSWATMVRAAHACGCALWAVTDDMWRNRINGWPFDELVDEGNRHFPAHLDVWRLEKAREWSGTYDKYSTWADPPFPPFSYRKRRRWR